VSLYCKSSPIFIKILKIQKMGLNGLFNAKFWFFLAFLALNFSKFNLWIDQPSFNYLPQHHSLLELGLGWPFITSHHPIFHLHSKIVQ
jgi:hypothetical protein